MTILSLDHLTNEALFNSIKTEFLAGDEKYRALRLDGAIINVDLSENNITTFKEKVISIGKGISKSFDPDLNEEIETEDDVYDTQVEEVSLNFRIDFLTPKIAELAESYKNVFAREVKRRNLFSRSQIENFSKAGLNQLSFKKMEILAAKHLDQDIKDEVVNSIDEVYEFVSNDYYQTNINIPNKIPLNFSKNLVIGLFKLLRENEYILETEISSNDLSRLIEQNFLYYDIETKTYKDITKARKLELQLFGANPEKSSKPTLDELQKIFSDKDFFSI